jgi:hypothetical protein
MTTTVLVDTFLNIIKRREDIKYRAYVPDYAANIGYVRTAELTASRCISISDRSTSLAANRVQVAGYTTITGEITFDTDTSELLITDVYVTPQNTVQTVPVFYKHIINTTNLPRTSITDLTIDSGYRLSNIQILDTNMKLVKVAAQEIDLTQGIIYNNLLSYYNSFDDYNFFYIRYTVTTSTSVITYTDLLDNQPIYTEATFDDLNSGMQLITDGRKVYLVEEAVAGFTITLPEVGTYSYKSLESSRIQVVKPSAEDANDPWYMRVTNGKFFVNILGVLHKYYLAEFLTQAFFPEPPIKKITLESVRRLDKITIKLDHENIHEDIVENLYVDIIITDTAGIGLYAFTTNPYLEGTIASNAKAYVVWNNIDRIGIRSLDHQGGFVNIEGVELKEEWTIEATYSYKEDKYEFTLIDCNPINNRDIVNTRIVLFISPDNTIDLAQSQTLYYLKVDSSGKVFESNWPNFDNTSQRYIDIDGSELYYELKPSWKPAGPNRIFVTSDSIEGYGVCLILGDITISAGTNPNVAEVFDSRTRGGGIVPARFDEVITDYLKARWCWDTGCWDGTPYPGKGCYLVEVPVIILEEAGGHFKSNEIKDIINRHTALGIYAIIRTYGVETDIDTLYTEQGMHVSWTGYGFTEFEPDEDISEWVI